MDRFIVREFLFLKTQQKYLKSSMDRFIGYANVDMTTGIANLKSSMDRFIDIHQSMYYQHRAFKIQYG